MDIFGSLASTPGNGDYVSRVHGELQASASQGWAMSIKKYQIFVSSTFEDLKEERRLAIQQILNMGHIPVGMELFQAGDVSQWDYIKKRISDCDYYIVIIGDRYGSLDQSGISYTEKEYRYAESLSIPTVAFLMNSEAIARLPRTRIETNARKIKKLDAFRSHCKKRISAFWDHPHELSAKLSTSLFELFQMRPRAGLVRPSRVAPNATAQNDPLAQNLHSIEWIKSRVQEEFTGLRLCATDIEIWLSPLSGKEELRDGGKVSISEAFPNLHSYVIEGFDIFDVLRRYDINHQPTTLWQVFQTDFEEKVGVDFLTWRQSLEAKAVILHFLPNFSPYDLVKKLEERGILELSEDKELWNWDDYWINWSQKGRGMVFAYEKVAGLPHKEASSHMVITMTR